MHKEDSCYMLLIGAVEHLICTGTFLGLAIVGGEFLSFLTEAAGVMLNNEKPLPRGSSGKRGPSAGAFVAEVALKSHELFPPKLTAASPPLGFSDRATTNPSSHSRSWE